MLFYITCDAARLLHFNKINSKINVKNSYYFIQLLHLRVILKIDLLYILMIILLVM